MPVLEDAVRFGGFVLAHAAWIASGLRPGELICPFAIITREGERKVIPFEAKTQAEAIAKGKASFDELNKEVDRWSLAREGLYSLLGEDAPKKDVITISSWVNGLDEPIILQQLFNPASSGDFHLMDEIMVFVHGTAPPGQTGKRLTEVALQGVAQHPHGWNWVGWQDQKKLRAKLTPDNP